MIETVQALCEALSQESVSVDDIAALAGHNPESTGLGTFNITPNDDSFTAIRIQTRDNVPSSVELTLDIKPRLGQLREAFGDYAAVPRVHPQDAARVVFTVDEGGPFTCSIFAHYDALIELSEETPVSSLTLRRNQRL